MNDRIMLYNGIVYLTKRLGKEYPDNFYDLSMKELKEIVEGLEQELMKMNCRCKHEHITRDGADIR